MKAKKTILTGIGIVILAAGIVLSLNDICEALTVTGWATGDNIFWVWDYKGAGNWDSGVWYPTNGWDNWMTAHKIYGDAEMGEIIDLYFAVKNVGTPSGTNPAGLLADIRTDSEFRETGTNYLFSDAAHWWIKAVSGVNFPNGINPTLLTGWNIPVWYAKNTRGAGSINPTYESVVDPDGDDRSIWYDEKSGKVYNINNNAQWIWTGNNFGSSMDNYVILHTRFTPTPEPASLLLFAIGIFGFGIVRKR